MNVVPLENLTLGHFIPLLNAPFRVYSDPAHMVELNLLEAAPSRRRAGAVSPEEASATQNFSLVFLGPPNPFLPQRIYAFEHEAIGRLILFIVPIGKERGGFLYEVVFNRGAENRS